MPLEKSLVGQGWVVVEGEGVIVQDAALSCFEMWFEGILLIQHPEPAITENND